jgi:hypothetical protein
VKRRKQFKTSEQLKKERELQASWNELMERNRFRSSTPPRNSDARPPTVRLGDAQLNVAKPNRRETAAKYPSKVSTGYIPLGPSVGSPTYTPEMQEREDAARLQIEARKKQVAPAYNKGGLQYITNPDDFKTMGKKV